MWKLGGSWKLKQFSETNEQLIKKAVKTSNSLCDVRGPVCGVLTTKTYVISSGEKRGVVIHREG